MLKQSDTKCHSECKRGISLGIASLRLAMTSSVILILVLFSIGTSQTERWVYRYDGPGNGVDEGLSLVYGSDGNIYTAGYSVGTGSSYDFTVISLTATGIQRWVYRYNGPIYGGANSLIYGSDGNIYVAGYSNGNGPYRDLVVISLTSTGTQRWVYRYNSPANSYNEAYSLVYGADSNIYVAGTTTDSGTENFTVISLSRSGTQRWVYHYIGPGNADAGANSIVYGTDRNIYVAGYSYDSGTDYDFTVISLSSTGTERWVYRYNGPGNGADEANSLVYGADSNIYVEGVSYGSGTDYDFTVISLSSTGTKRWVYRYNGLGNGYDETNDLFYGIDSNIYVAGTSTGSGTDYDFTVISLSSTGTERWVYRYNGSGNDCDQARSLVYGADENIYVAGSSMSIGFYNTDITVVSLNPIIGIEERTTVRSPQFVFRCFGSRIEFTATLSKPTNIPISIYNITGEKVFTFNINASAGTSRHEEDLSFLPTGVYVVKADIENRSVSKKFVVVK